MKTVAAVYTAEALVQPLSAIFATGDGGRHDELLMATALRLAGDVDLLVLAQGSMARMEEEIAEATGKPVLSSPRSGVEALKAHLASQ